MTAYIYINPKAPAGVKDLLAKHFSNASKVSAMFMQEVTGASWTKDQPCLNTRQSFLMKATSVFWSQ
jgi:hypothetical protein